MRTPSSSMQRVDANGVLLDRNKASIKEIRPFEAIKALGIVVGAKAWALKEGQVSCATPWVSQ